MVQQQKVNLRELNIKNLSLFIDLLSYLAKE